MPQIDGIEVCRRIRDKVACPVLFLTARVEKQENAEKITEAFYGQNVKDSLKHAGIGMYISRLYCEKHGGKLVLGNGEQGGAAVTAIFRRIV